MFPNAAVPNAGSPWPFCWVSPPERSEVVDTRTSCCVAVLIFPEARAVTNLSGSAIAAAFWRSRVFKSRKARSLWNWRTEVAHLSAKASTLSLSDIGIESGGRCTADELNAPFCSRGAGARVAEDNSGVIGEYGGAKGDSDRLWGRLRGKGDDIFSWRLRRSVRKGMI